MGKKTNCPAEADGKVHQFPGNSWLGAVSVIRRTGTRDNNHRRTFIGVAFWSQAWEAIMIAQPKLNWLNHLSSSGNLWRTFVAATIFD